jgi:hypothetical protein
VNAEHAVQQVTKDLLVNMEQKEKKVDLVIQEEKEKKVHKDHRENLVTRD